MTFVKLKDAQGRIVYAELNPELRLSAGREVLSNGSVLEAWAPSGGLRSTPPAGAKHAKAWKAENERLEKIRVERAKRRKMKRKAQRRGR